MAYAQLTSKDLVDRLAPMVSESDSARPRITFILGSGFSHPLIPTTSQIVRENLPWWALCQSRSPGGPAPSDFFESARAEQFADRAQKHAIEFWEKVRASADRQASGDTSFSLGGDGLPERADVAAAYCAALSPWCTPGLHTPEMVRRYFAALVKRIANRLNPAHLYMASLLQEKPQLCGTIFTTNFDPLLQRSLQLVNRPYFVSDRPETMQHPDDDEITDALHLVYAHGSVYRYLLLNTPDEIQAHATRNEPLLQEYFRKHAVVIIGYSGWDDAITRALESIDNFSNNLYWCDLAPSPQSSGLSAAAKRLLEKHQNAFYVPIAGADEILADLYYGLVRHVLPRLFRSPIEVVREQLSQCDFAGKTMPGQAIEHGVSLNRNGVEVPVVPLTGTSMTNNERLSLGEIVKTISGRLENAQRYMLGESIGEVGDKDPIVLKERMRERMLVATDIFFGAQPWDAIRHFDVLISNSNVLTTAEIVKVRFRRAVAYTKRGGESDFDSSITDLSAIVEMGDVLSEDRARALVNRGFSYSQRGHEGDLELAIADYTAVIRMKDVSLEQRSMAQINRGVCYSARGSAGDLDREIAEYDEVIALAGVSTRVLATAMVNRAAVRCERGKDGDTELAIAEFGIALDLVDAPADQRARALLGRGNAYQCRGLDGDIDKALADYTAVVAMDGLQPDQRSLALLSCADIYLNRQQSGDIANAESCCTSVMLMEDAPLEAKNDAKQVMMGIARSSGGRSDPG